MVPKESAIAQVLGVTNAVTVDADGLAPITLVGPGAGGMATASAVVSDLPISRAGCALPFGRPAARMSPIRKAPMQRHEGGTTSACWRVTAPAALPPLHGGWRNSRSPSNRSCSAKWRKRRAPPRPAVRASRCR
jgi:hypothetical protein